MTPFLVVSFKIFKKTVKSVVYSFFLLAIHVVFSSLSSTASFASDSKHYSKLTLSSGFFNQKINDQDKIQTYDFFARNKFKYSNSKFKYKHDLGFLFQYVDGFNTYSPLVSELYVSLKGESHQIFLGRKKQLLNHADKEWALGLTQSLYLQDPLNPISQGQFGFHYEFKNKSFFLKAFATHIHLPHQGPTFTNEDNLIQSGNPWFNRPPERIQEAGGLTDVRYNVNIPEVKDVVLQPAASLQLGMNHQQFWWNVSYMNQVNNEFHKSYRFSQETAPQQVFVDVDAEALRQELYSANLGFNLNAYKIWLSFLKDKPSDDYTKGSAWVETHLDTQNWFSAGLKKKNFIFKNLNFSTSYIKRVDSENKKETLLDTSELDSLVSRSYFERSHSLNYKIKYKYKINSSSKITVQQSFEHSLLDKSQVIQAKISYTKNNFNIFTDAAVISAKKDDKTSFQSKFQGNDYVRLGAGYVF